MPQVRLRGDQVSLPVNLDIAGKGVLRAVLKPGVWTTVEPEISDFLKYKFGKGSSSVRVPDVDQNEKNPHKIGEAAATREEQPFDHETYIIEFR